MTKADIATSRLLVYQSLPFSIRGKVNDFLFSTDSKATHGNNLFEMLADISEAQFGYLVRMVVVGKSESQRPDDILGYSLYKIAENAGLDVAAIEEKQAEIAEDRARKIALRVSDLEAKIKKLNKILELAEAQ